MTVATGNFPELLWPGIREIWGDTYNRYQTLYTQAFTVQRSTKAFEKYQGVTNLPLAAVKDQGAPVQYVDPFQGYQKELVHTTYALGSSITREMVEDDQYNYIRKIPQFLAESMRQTEETVAWNIFNNAFGSTVGADGQPLLSNAHPLIGGGTMSNVPDTDADLTEAALEAAVTDIMDWEDDMGLKIRAVPTRLIVPNALWHVAEKILRTEKVVDSADNTVNVVRNRISRDPLVVPYLTDPDAWFLLVDIPVDEGLIFLNRRDAEIERDNEFDTQNLKTITTRRFSVGAVNFRRLYGSPGA